jgi:hypothetical protein
VKCGSFYLEVKKKFNFFLEDEVPLQINLFSDSNLKDIMEILEIYQEYGEITGCITSTLSSDNTPALAISDVNFGVNLNPSFVCRTCNGMRKDFKSQKKPTIFEFISMKINSIFCSFVIDETSNYSSLSKIFSTARFMLFRIKLNLKFFVHVIYYLILLQFPSYIIMTKPILDEISLVFIIFIFFPLILFGILTINKTPFDHLEVMRPSKRIKEKIAEQESKYLKLIIKLFFKFLLIGSNIAILNAIYFKKLFDFSYFISENIVIIDTVNGNKTQNFTFILNNNNIPFSNFTYELGNYEYLSPPRYIFNNSAKNQNINLNTFLNDNFQYLSIVYFYIIIWFLCSLSFLFVDKFESIFSFSFIRNYKFLLFNIGILSLATGVFLIRLNYQITSHTIEFESYYIVIFILGNFAIFILDYLTKLYFKKVHINKQKNIKIIIETRLGTYSPK